MHIEIKRHKMQLKQKFERKLIKLSELKFDESNPNKMGDKQVKALNKSIEHYGYVQDIIVDKDSLLIADGEHRARELINKGINEAEIILYPFKNDTDRRMFRQISNKLHGEHEIDLDIKEYKKILESEDLEVFSNLTSISEQSILNLINQENKEIKKIEEVEKLAHLEVKCPKCGFLFKKREG